MDPLISIIIPVYKVEKYLDACVESVVSQTYSNLEIILIDDESPDRCGEMCDVWAKRDSRIRVIHQKNAGAYAARNAGLAIAQGEFIGFADPDDMISPHMFEYLYQNIQQYEAEVSICSHLKFSETATVEQIQKSLQEAAEKEYPVTIWKVEDELHQPLFSNYTGKVYVLWKQLFRRSSVPRGNMWFDTELRAGGDTLFISQYASDCRRAVYSSYPLYAYRIVPNSDCRRLSPDRVRKNIYIAEQLTQYLRRTGKQKMLDKYEADFYRQSLARIFAYYKSWSAILHYQIQIRKETEFRQQLYKGIKQRGIAYQILYWITFYSPLYFSVLFFRMQPISFLVRCKRQGRKIIATMKSILGIRR